MTISRRTFVQTAAAAVAAGSLCSTAMAEEVQGNRVCQILGIEKPVVQAIMFDMTNAELVAGVSNAGGLGVLSMTTREQIAEVKALTNKPFAVSTYFADDETVAILKEEGIQIICAGTVEAPGGEGWIVDQSGVKFWKDNGFTVLCKALNVTLDGALAIQEAGADILIPVGYGAGGCAPYNTVGYPALLSEFSKHIDIPMLAAGGVVDAATAFAGKVAGAEGAYCGTRFLATEESNCCDAAKQIILETRGEQLIDMPTSLYGQVYSIVPCAKSPLTEKAVEMYRNGASYDEITEFNGTNAQFWMSMSAGNIDEWGVGMDRSVSLITEILPIQQIVDDIAAPFLD